MMAQDPNASSGTEASPHVERDTPCVRCGYNLRMQPWNGVCPECGWSVLQSGNPIGFSFHSRRSERRARIGIGLLAVALIVQALGTCAMTAAARLIFVIQAPVHWAALYIWVYAGWLGDLVRFGAILLITQPLARGNDRFRPCLTPAAVILAVVGIMGLLFDLASRFPSGTSGMRGIEIVIAEHIGGLCFTVAYVLTCVHLFSRVDRTVQPFLWWLTRGAVATSMLLLFEHSAWVARFYLEPGYSSSSPYGERSTAWQQVITFLFWWSKNIRPTCQAAILTACLLFLQRLRTCSRAPAAS